MSPLEKRFGYLKSLILKLRTMRMKLRTQWVWGMVTVVGLSLSLFGACANELHMGGKKVTHMGTPENPNDATTKAYVDRGGAEITPSVITHTDGLTYAGGKAWLDRNLGATRVAQSLTDTEAYGDLFQWSRATDGHQNRGSSTTDIVSTKAIPTHGHFIIAQSPLYNWLDISSQYTNLWSGTGGNANGVCPTGWRVPSKQDFRELDIEDTTDAFNRLKLTLGGFRNGGGGELNEQGIRGRYWTSDSDDNSIQSATSFTITNDIVTFSGNYRANGFSIRCVKSLK